MTISQEQLPNHLTGETVPARCVNSLGRALHRLSTMPDDRPSREEYYAEQPRTVNQGIGKIATGAKPIFSRVAQELNPKYLFLNAGHLAAGAEELALKIVDNCRLEPKNSDQQIQPQENQINF